MLQPEVRGVVAQRQQKVILAVVSRAKQGSCLSNEPLVVVDGVSGKLQSGFAVRRGVDVMLDRSLGREWSAAEMCAGQDRRVHERGERNGLESGFVAVFAGNDQGRIVMPARGQLERGRE